MTTLDERLARRIATGGPITVAEYMAAALSDPDLGYYRKTDPLGAAGDFTTAPEISQLFGELIGAWLIDLWERIGRPDPVRLVELGPGRGTLMSDALRVGRLRPGWLDAADLHLVEINPALRKLQAERLSGYRPHCHDSLDTVPDGPMLLVANEFFDALPIRQLVHANGVWRERLVGWNAESGFHFTASPLPSPLSMLIPADLRRAAEGSVVEISPASIGIASADRAPRCRSTAGAALIIDYGRFETGTRSNRCRRCAATRRADVLTEPGGADLSAHVDFAALGAGRRRSVERSPFGPVSQGRISGNAGHPASCADA